MATPLFGSQVERNRYANTETIDRTGLVARAKADRQENLAGIGRTFRREAFAMNAPAACE
jgi:hypothetical protein